MNSICIVGAGLMGETHLDIYRRLGCADRCYVVDIDPARARSLAEKYGAIHSPSIDALDQDAQIDIFDICVPTRYHMEYIRKAVDRNAHILVEKPAVFDLEEARLLAELLTGYSRAFMCAMVDCYFQPFLLAAQHCAGQELMDFSFVRFGRLPSASSWYFDELQSGGVFMDLGVHDIAFHLKLVKPDMDYKMRAVQGVVGSGGKVVEANICYGSQSFGSFTVGWILSATHSAGFYNSFRLITSQKTIVYDSSSNVLTVNGEAIGVVENRYPDAYQREIELFLNRTRNFDQRDNVIEVQAVQRTMQIMRLIDVALSGQ